MIRLAGVAVVGVLLLSGCGAQKDLRPAKGETLPVAPYGANAKPTPDELIAPSPQQRPDRSDDLLTQSTERTDDPFDQPPK